MARTGPPAYAWDWFARQRLLWRECRTRLARDEEPAAARYHAVEARADVLALLRRDYPTDPAVHRVVDEVVAEVAFLSRTHARWRDLGVRNAPRGMRWWWTAVTGEELDAARRPPPPAAAAQLSLDDLAGTDPQRAMDEVHEGYGG